MENYNTCSTELIDGDGNFNVTGIDQFSKGVQFAECGISYAVVSILGPQSSGKSTLLNSLFGTNFREMNAFNGRSQTTKGIWMAKGDGIDPCTIVMDLEGTDGRERGEDDTAFEKQSALFALAVSDIVLINMWCHDIGREHAANKPLLKIVFQAMARLFTPRKTTLMFVIRDKTSTPLEKLASLLREDTQKIWDSVPKPQAHKNTLLSDFFNFEFVAFSNYEYQKQEFIQQIFIPHNLPRQTTCYTALSTPTNCSFNADDLLPNGDESSTCTSNVNDLLPPFSLNSFSSRISTPSYPVSPNADALLKKLLESSLSVTSLLENLMAMYEMVLMSMPKSAAKDFLTML